MIKKDVFAIMSNCNINEFGPEFRITKIILQKVKKCALCAYTNPATVTNIRNTEEAV